MHLLRWVTGQGMNLGTVSPPPAHGWLPALPLSTPTMTKSPSREWCLAGRAWSVVAFRGLFLPIPPQRIRDFRSGNIPSISPGALLKKQLATRFTTTDRLEETRVIWLHRKQHSTLESFINKVQPFVKAIQLPCPDRLVYNSHCGHQSLQDTETSPLAPELGMEKVLLAAGHSSL